MTISEINSFVNLRTGTTTTEYSAANRLISTNRWYHKVTDMIYDSLLDYQHQDLNLTSEPILTKDFVANQEYVALGLTDEILRINRVEMDLTASGTYYKAEPINQSQIPTSILNQTTINDDFSTTQPYFEHKGQLLYTYPVPTANVTGGLKLWVEREADEFSSAQVTTGTKEPGFDEPWHVMVALGMCYDWFASKMGDKAGRDKFNAIKEELMDYEARLRLAYGRKNGSNFKLSAGYIDYN